MKKYFSFILIILCVVLVNGNIKFNTGATLDASMTFDHYKLYPEGGLAMTLYGARIGINSGAGLSIPDFTVKNIPVYGTLGYDFDLYPFKIIPYINAGYTIDLENFESSYAWGRLGTGFQYHLFRNFIVDLKLYYGYNFFTGWSSLGAGLAFEFNVTDESETERVKDFTVKSLVPEIKASDIPVDVGYELNVLDNRGMGLGNYEYTIKINNLKDDQYTIDKEKRIIHLKRPTKAEDLIGTVVINKISRDFKITVKPGAAYTSVFYFTRENITNRALNDYTIKLFTAEKQEVSYNVALKDKFGNSIPDFDYEIELDNYKDYKIDKNKKILYLYKTGRIEEIRGTLSVPKYDLKFGFIISVTFFPTKVEYKSNISDFVANEGMTFTIQDILLRDNFNNSISLKNFDKDGVYGYGEDSVAYPPLKFTIKKYSRGREMFVPGYSNIILGLENKDASNKLFKIKLDKDITRVSGDYRLYITLPGYNIQTLINLKIKPEIPVFASFRFLNDISSTSTDVSFSATETKRLKYDLVIKDKYNNLIKDYDIKIDNYKDFKFDREDGVLSMTNATKPVKLKGIIDIEKYPFSFDFNITIFPNDPERIIYRLDKALFKAIDKEVFKVTNVEVTDRFYNPALNIDNSKIKFYLDNKEIKVVNDTANIPGDISEEAGKHVFTARYATDKYNIKLDTEFEIIPETPVLGYYKVLNYDPGKFGIKVLANDNPVKILNGDDYQLVLFDKYGNPTDSFYRLYLTNYTEYTYDASVLTLTRPIIAKDINFKIIYPDGTEVLTINDENLKKAVESDMSYTAKRLMVKSVISKTDNSKFRPIESGIRIVPNEPYNLDFPINAKYKNTITTVTASNIYQIKADLSKIKLTDKYSNTIPFDKDVLKFTVKTKDATFTELSVEQMEGKFNGNLLTKADDYFIKANYKNASAEYNFAVIPDKPAKVNFKFITSESTSITFNATNTQIIKYNLDLRDAYDNMAKENFRLTLKNFTSYENDKINSRLIMNAPIRSETLKGVLNVENYDKPIDFEINILPNIPDLIECSIDKTTYTATDVLYAKVNKLNIKDTFGNIINIDPKKLKFSNEGKEISFKNNQLMLENELSSKKGIKKIDITYDKVTSQISYEIQPERPYLVYFKMIGEDENRTLTLNAKTTELATNFERTIKYEYLVMDSFGNTMESDIKITLDGTATYNITKNLISIKSPITQKTITGTIYTTYGKTLYMEKGKVIPGVLNAKNLLIEERDSEIYKKFKEIPISNIIPSEFKIIIVTTDK